MTRLKKGYVIDPEPLWRPNYRISPFNTGFVKKNHEIITKGNYSRHLTEQYFPSPIIPTINGRSAIFRALSQYNLKSNDEVWIITTSGNWYISSCVTKEIEKFCKWSMIRTERTKLIFVNNEFGFCYKELQNLKATGLHIIEDRALSFASEDDNGLVGISGDFTIYSLPKFFPISFGGILQCNNYERMKSFLVENTELECAFYAVMNYYLPALETIKKKRNRNFKYLTKLFAADSLHPFFIPGPKEIPGAFMFKVQCELPGLKAFMQRNGIESSVFYGEEAFYIPVHQELSLEDMNLFHMLVNHFLKYGDE